MLRKVLEGWFGNRVCVFTSVTIPYTVALYKYIPRPLPFFIPVFVLKNFSYLYMNTFTLQYNY